MTVLAPHPAKFSQPVLEVIRECLDEAMEADPRTQMIIDPFAGVGGIHDLNDPSRHRYTWGLEIEEEWAKQHNLTFVGDVLGDWPSHLRFNWCVTSPCYGNRMADTYTDHTRRHTYTSYLGRLPSGGSSASMQWGDEYRAFHSRAWSVVRGHLRGPGGLVLNIKDHIRKRQRVHVADWHVEALQKIGFKLRKRLQVDAAGIRHGENHESRIDYEEVIWFDSYFWVNPVRESIANRTARRLDG